MGAGKREGAAGLVKSRAQPGTSIAPEIRSAVTDLVFPDA